MVIAGAGLAGARTAVELREQGWDGPVTLLGGENRRPYDRPPLSKEVMLGQAESSELDIDYAALDITLLQGRAATGLDPAARLLHTDGGPLRYRHLVLATGAEAVALPGARGGTGAASGTAPGVHVLRTLDDALALREVLAARGRLVVVGAGWIGAELTTAARAAGCPVTVVEASGQVLAGALPAEVTAPMRRWYAESGAALRTRAPVAAVRTGAVELAGGQVLGADAVLIGIGARPATGWLAGSGVPLDPADGSVRADATLRVPGVPDVWAAGDCASYPSARYGRRMLVHHWDNALHAPRTVAAGILGRAERYDPVPYFWSDQFGRTVQYAGYHGDAGTPLWRGDPESGAGWTVCWLREGRLTALLTVDRPRDAAQGRRLIDRGTPLDPARAADPAVPLKSAALR
ncbi:NADPH-dependent 2,4-dienoyl-CoA reductase, sulfur reductase [Streptomyces aidingensis]|uniref:NADPH-dependent 2,4-dienoyl-CoA reductase, sulfur reductase n=1 Tax=Streptomyces aidingensis TaxID=910347 RepID=A0A1I1LIL6_9ACTN|nr:NADPH-dependent 2,4-dienoyl-CoA reductase, sulfur reductase [Streptomyces aidingensis]